MAIPKKRGDSFRVRIDYYDSDGKRHQRSITAATKKEAERLAASYKIARTGKDIFFGEAVNRYIESKTNIVKPSTIKGYRTIERNYIGSLKNIRLSRISNEIIQAQLNNIAADKDPKTVDNTRALISSVLKMFLPAFQLIVNTPAKIRKEVNIPSDNELKALLNAAAGRREEVPILLAAYGSLREGEISALMPDCVHDSYITIKRSYSQADNNTWHLTETPKSEAGYRDIPLPPDIMEKLQTLVMEYSGDEFGITGLKPNQIRSRFETTRKKAGVNCKFHALRHYFASFLHEKNIPDKTIAKLGGWEDVTTLQKIYQHSTHNSEAKAAAIITEQFETVGKM